MSDGDLVATAQSLALDRTAAATATALRERGIDAIVLKGPILARWLYADGTPRPYGDVDLLVAPRDLGRAYDVVAEVGGEYVDLTDVLNGAGLNPSRAWELLRSRAVTERVAGTDVLAFDPVARMVHIAMHAWWHGPSTAKPLLDLDRALSMLPEEDWRAAAALAGELRASRAFDGGLALDPAGRELLGRLGRPVPAWPPGHVAMAEASPAVRRREELRLRSGAGAKVHLIRRVALPVPGEVRAHYPSARGGRRQLAAAYTRRMARGISALPRMVRRKDP